MTDIAEFDVCGPLPTGVTVLEASAGTGKTFTIAALAARYIADGTPPARLLLVTFTRMATGELRDRVRERLLGAEQALARVLAGAPAPEHDRLLSLLAAGPVEEVARRHRCLAAALADFDAATIATTHGFCQQVLTGLGVAGEVEGEYTFTDDARDLVTEVVDDLYVRKFYAGGPPPFTRKQALAIGRKAVAHHDADLEPQHADRDTDAAMRVRLADAVRREFERRKRNSAIMTYDDLQTRLRDTLADRDRGAAAGDLVRSQYDVVLVDEFQDTDPVQWEILRRAFAGDNCALVLIGDPKQAIYAFRGADVYSYLEAARSAGTRATLGVNWRSDQGLVDAYDAVFGGTTLGHPGIAYRKVRAADGHTERLAGAPVAAPLRVRVVHRSDGLVRLTKKLYAESTSAREHVAADLAADVVRLLSSGAELIGRSSAGAETGREPVRPGHCAVLVRYHRDAALVRDALAAVGVPAVINGAGSVFGTAAAASWLRLLEALERPSGAGPAHALALTDFLGWTAEQVADADDDAWESLHARLHRWAGVLRRRGVAALVDTVTQAEELPGRLLAYAGGERQLTDLRHIGQLLHAVAIAEQLGITALTGWLRERMGDADSDPDVEDRARRLDSDAEAVQVLTIYRSKGLEFPVVYCPYLWHPDAARDEESPLYHDPDDGDRRKLDVGDSGHGLAGHRNLHQAEQRGEELRLAYVALTRAQHQAVVWWAASYQSRDSALSRLVFSRDEAGNIAASAKTVRPEDEVVAELNRIGERAPGCISVERTDGGAGSVWCPPAAAPASLQAGRFDRRLDPLWRRTSYSGITAGTYEPRVASEAEVPALTDEPVPGGVGTEVPALTDEPVPGGVGTEVPALTDEPVPGGVGTEVPAPADEDARPAATDDPLWDVPCPLAELPAGAEVGVFVHAVLEQVDFAAEDLDSDLAAGIGRQLARRRVAVGDPDLLVAGLRAAIDTPLGPLFGATRLRDIARADRIDELGFELPLVGGDSPTATLGVDSIGAALVAHLPVGDPLAAYADRLADPRLRRELRGYLAGSLDLVLRVIAADGTPRFAVVDYKTNWLGDRDGTALTAWHYRPAALLAEMYHAHYPLQALLYTVALHRYLRWRLPGYTAERNLAGVAYLFLRGMTGAGTPLVDGVPCGVFAWRPPAGLVESLSDLLDRGAA